MKDNEALEKKICPDCGLILYFYFGDDRTKPWCKKCDVYFTRMGDWVVRNTNATQEYNRLYVDTE